MIVNELLQEAKDLNFDYDSRYWESLGYDSRYWEFLNYIFTEENEIK